MRRALAVAFFTVACGPGRAPSPPVAMTIRPVGTSDAPTVATAVDPETAEAPLQMAFAGNRLCVRSDGRVYCQPSTGSPVSPLVQDELRVAGVEDAIDLSGNRSLMCVATRRGTVMCAGTNTHGELGARAEDEETDHFVEVVGVAHARRVAAGITHACALLDDKSVKCWGRNDHGQTGSDTYYMPQARLLATATLVPGVKAESVAAGNESTCARTPERQVVCWGMQQDQGPRMKAARWTNERPTRIPDLDDVSALQAQDEGYCAIRRGRVLCWGQARRLIPGTDYFGSGIVSVADLKDIQQVALSDSHACALHGDGRVSCFGYPYTGALGRPQPSDPTKQYDAVTPTLVEPLPRAKFVGAGGTLSCALTSNNDVYCWGRWYTDGGTHDEPSPISIQLR